MYNVFVKMLNLDIFENRPKLLVKCLKLHPRNLNTNSYVNNSLRIVPKIYNWSRLWYSKIGLCFDSCLPEFLANLIKDFGTIFKDSDIKEFLNVVLRYEYVRFCQLCFALLKQVETFTRWNYTIWNISYTLNSVLQESDDCKHSICSKSLTQR